MLENNTVQPNGNKSNEDKKTITAAMNYLNMMGYAEEIEWLPEDLNYTRIFQRHLDFKSIMSRIIKMSLSYVGYSPILPLQSPGMTYLSAPVFIFIRMIKVLMRTL